MCFFLPFFTGKRKWSLGNTTIPHHFCSVTQSYSTLCDPIDCSMPGFSVFHYLLEFAQIQVHWVNDAIQPSHPLSPSFPALYPPILHNRRTNTRNRVRKTGGQKSDIRDKEGDRQLFPRNRVIKETKTSAWNCTDSPKIQTLKLKFNECIWR